MSGINIYRRSLVDIEFVVVDAPNKENFLAVLQQHPRLNLPVFFTLLVTVKYYFEPAIGLIQRVGLFPVHGSDVDLQSYNGTDPGRRCADCGNFQ